MRRIFLIGSLFSLGITFALFGKEIKRSTFPSNASEVAEPSCAIRPCRSANVMATGELLWWRAGLDNIAYALQITELDLSRSTLESKLKEPTFSYDPGVRLGLGYDFGESNWDLNLFWTYYTTKAHSSAASHFKITDVFGDPNRPGVSLLDGQFFGKDGTAALSQLSPQDQTKTAWNLRFNALDLELGYPLCVSSRFSLRPYMGVKAAWINMRLNIESKIFPQVLSPTATTAETALAVHLKSDFWGVGPDLGVNGFLHFNKEWRLFGKIASAFLYGECSGKDAHHSLLVTAATGGAGQQGATFDNQTAKYEDHFRLRAMAQAMLGLEWKRCFSNRFEMGVHIAWETQYWWNQLQFPFFTNGERSGDLTFAGINAGMECKF